MYKRMGVTNNPFPVPLTNVDNINDKKSLNILALSLKKRLPWKEVSTCQHLRSHGSPKGKGKSNNFKSEV